jgi:hypothetical protein
MNAFPTDYPFVIRAWYGSLLQVIQFRISVIGPDNVKKDKDNFRESFKEYIIPSGVEVSTQDDLNDETLVIEDLSEKQSIEEMKSLPKV